MSEPTPGNLKTAPSKSRKKSLLRIRKLAHELSTALEVIVQTSYLLGTVEMKEPGTDWLRMLDNGVRKALDLNQALRNLYQGAPAALAPGLGLISSPHLLFC